MLLVLTPTTNQEGKDAASTYRHTYSDQSCTYIGNDRELADPTENVVPNPWRLHSYKQRGTRKVHVQRKGSVSQRPRWRSREEQRGAERSREEEKVIKRC